MRIILQIDDRVRELEERIQKEAQELEVSPPMPIEKPDAVEIIQSIVKDIIEDSVAWAPKKRRYTNLDMEMENHFPFWAGLQCNDDKKQTYLTMTLYERAIDPVELALRNTIQQTLRENMWLTWTISHFTDDLLCISCGGDYRIQVLEEEGIGYGYNT